ncbi:hypothetical protein EI94DRAFT_935878 [Lactarius quietus]|nr:hypothetical protein EI94DRAFT_935878 [Lactarius quietus]
MHSRALLVHWCFLESSCTLTTPQAAPSSSRGFSRQRTSTPSSPPRSGSSPFLPCSRAVRERWVAPTVRVLTRAARDMQGRQDHTFFHVSGNHLPSSSPTSDQSRKFGSRVSFMTKCAAANPSIPSYRMSSIQVTLVVYYRIFVCTKLAESGSAKEKLYGIMTTPH